MPAAAPHSDPATPRRHGRSPLGPDVRPRSHRPRRRVGQSVVEFALVLPVFIFLLLMAVDFGRLFFTYIEVSNGAREAAAYGATNPTDTVGMGTKARGERSYQAQTGESAMADPTTACADGSGTAIACAAAPGGTGLGNTLTVTVTEHFTFLTPFINGFFGSGLDVKASATTVVLGSVAGGTIGGVGPCSAPTVATFTVTQSNLDIVVNPAGSQPDAGLCTISGYNWDYGDGNTDVGSTIPSNHTYAAPGTYTVTLQVTNQGGSLTATKTINVPASATPTPTPTPTPTTGPTPTPTPTPTPACALPVANFNYSNGNPRKDVSFTSTSTPTSGFCPITNWSWDFGDGSTDNTNAPNPFHSFGKNNSSYKVTLKVTNAAGSATYQVTVTT